MKTALKYIGP